MDSDRYLDKVEGQGIVYTSPYEEFPEFFTDDINGLIEKAVIKLNELNADPLYKDSLIPAFENGMLTREELEGLAIYRAVTGWTDSRPLTSGNALRVFKIFLQAHKDRYSKYPAKDS